MYNNCSDILKKNKNNILYILKYDYKTILPLLEECESATFNRYSRKIE